jgi:hypothetical protein
MRTDATVKRVRDLLRGLGRAAEPGCELYLAGGASAVLCGWRDSTRDVDIRLEGPDEAVLRAPVDLKEKLDTNVELSSPLDFPPAPPGWRERRVFVGTFGALNVDHIPFALQALAKLNRRFDQDIADVQAMLAFGLTTREDIRTMHAAIVDELFRAPSVSPTRLGAAVDALCDVPFRRLSRHSSGLGSMTPNTQEALVTASSYYFR